MRNLPLRQRNIQSGDSCSVNHFTSYRFSRQRNGSYDGAHNYLNRLGNWLINLIS